MSSEGAAAAGRFNPKQWLRGLVLIATFVAIGYALKGLGVSDLLGTHWIDEQVKGKGLDGELVYILAGTVATAVGMPRQFIAFLGGYAFGFVEGGLMGLAASGLGCLLSFFYARLMGRSLVRNRFPGRVRKFDEFLRDNPFSMTLLVRLLPVGSNLVTNLVAGVTSVRAAPFLLGSVVGYLPQTAVFALLGSGVQLDAELRIALSVGLFLVSGVLGVMLYRRFRRSKALDDDVGAAE